MEMTLERGFARKPTSFEIVDFELETLISGQTNAILSKTSNLREPLKAVS